MLKRTHWKPLERFPTPVNAHILIVLFMGIEIEQIRRLEIRFTIKDFKTAKVVSLLWHLARVTYSKTLLKFKSMCRFHIIKTIVTIM